MLLNKQVSSLIFSVLFGLTFSYAFAQKDCDCRIPDLDKKIIKLNIHDSTEVFNLIKEVGNMESVGCKFQQLNLEFKFNLIQKQIDKAVLLLNEQENFLKERTCDEAYLFGFLYNKTLYFKSINDFEKLSDFVFKSLKKAEELKDADKEILAIQEIVFLFTRMKENTKRWSYVKRAETLILNQKKPINLVLNYRWLAYQYENEYTKTERKTLIDSALVLINKAKSQALKHEMYNELASAYRGLEAISYHKGELAKALVFIDSAIYYAKKVKGANILSGFYLSKAWDHYDLQQYDEASIWMDSSLFYDINNDLAGHMMLLSEAAQIYEGAGKLDKAYKSYKSYSKMKDSILSKERLEVINELDAKYQTEVKDAQIKRLIILLIVALLIIILTLFIAKMIQLKRTKQKNKELKLAFDKQITLEKELSNVRDHIAQDFHDDLGNKLARISLLSNLVADNLSEKDENIKSKIKQVREDANSLYVGTRDFVFSLKSNSDYLEEVVTYLSDFGEDLFASTNIKFVLQKELSDNKKLPYYWSKQLIYVFKEAMTNALKHSRSTEVILVFEYRENNLIIQCIDNGIGLTDTQMESTNGILNMKKRARKIKGNLIIESPENKGTIVKFIGNTTQ